eukprot:Nk52_evm21s1763 gene=Nk52_evmTU21s1763
MVKPVTFWERVLATIKRTFYSAFVWFEGKKKRKGGGIDRQRVIQEKAHPGTYDAVKEIKDTKSVVCVEGEFEPFCYDCVHDDDFEEPNTDYMSLVNDNCFLLTYSQCTPEWFAMRKAGVSSSVSGAMLSKLRFTADVIPHMDVFDRIYKNIGPTSDNEDCERDDDSEEEESTLDIIDRPSKIIIQCLHIVIKSVIASFST